jgi:hypothetical protein
MPLDDDPQHGEPASKDPDPSESLADTEAELHQEGKASTEAHPSLADRLADVIERRKRHEDHGT